MKPLYLFLFSLFFALSDRAWAAACCGTGVVLPSLLTSLDKSQWTGTWSSARVRDQVGSDGIWHPVQVPFDVQTLRFNGAHLIHEKWQVGLQVPVVQRSHPQMKATSLGDVTTTLGYEYLSNLNGERFRPKGIGFLQLITPTGNTRAESDFGGLDIGGNGFWALGLGTALTKTYRNWDAFGSLQVHRSLTKDVDRNQLKGRLHPGWGGALNVGGGRSFDHIRLGASLAWFYEDPVDFRGNSSFDGSVERYATFSVMASYLFGADWSTTFIYSDQGLFGSPVNTSLARSVALQIQRRWPSY